MQEEPRYCRLYLLTPPQIDLETFPALLADALDAGDVACLQIRLRDEAGNQVEEAVMKAAADAIIPVCHERDVAVLLESFIDLADECGADGVHIAFGDEDIAALRAHLGEEFMLGVACGDSRHNAMEAAELGADYVSFGPYFESRNKPDAAVASRDHLSWWQAMMEVPVVAVGGITADTAFDVAREGADFVAVIDGVWQSKDGAAGAVKAISEALDVAL